MFVIKYLQPNLQYFVKINMKNKLKLSDSKFMRSLKSFCMVFVTALYLLAINSCKPTNSLEEGPALPSEESMIMNFDFTDKVKSAFVDDSALPYHTRAALAIQYWSNVAVYQTVVPAAAFKAAIGQKPVLQDSIWIWQFNVATGNNNYYAKLKGQVKGDSVQWKMYISKVDASINNFLWFEGKSHVSRTGGWWIIYYPMSISSAIVSEAGLQVNWAITSDKVKWLQYTYVANRVWGTNSYIDNVNKGGYIKFGLQVDPQYDAYYDIYNKSEDKLWEILWNRSTKAGKINLNSAAVGCWDNTLADKTSCE